MDLTTRFGTITLSRAIEVFAPIFVLAHNWNLDDKHEKVLAGKKQYIKDVLLEEVRSKRLKGKIVSNLAYDAEDEPVGYELDYKATSFDIKEASQFLFALLRKNGSPILNQLSKVDEAEQEDGNVNLELQDDIMYPSYRGMEFEGLKKEKFEELKRHYGMLQVEVAKLNKTVHIAADIGLLFYEKELVKPATLNAFVESYKKNFAGIPMRLVHAVYDALPDKYKSLGGDSVKELKGINDDTIDLIIETSVAAGLLCSDELVKDAKALEKELARYGFDQPPETLLKAISGACKRVYRQYHSQL